ncbi:MAG: adenylate kinase [archaeon]
MKLVFLGPPGAGKGTQAKIISEKFRIPHISTGDIFRENLKNSTHLGKKASEYMSKGLLVPDEVTNAMVEDRLKKKDCIKGYILDGYPRTINQAEFLDSIVKLDKVINFELNEDVIIKRISGRRTCKSCGTPYNILHNKPKTEGICDKCKGPLIQRDDEKPDVVKKRLLIYKDQTEPLINYYKNQKILVDVDAYPTIESVTGVVEKILE